MSIVLQLQMLKLLLHVSSTYVTDDSLSTTAAGEESGSGSGEWAFQRSLEAVTPILIPVQRNTILESRLSLIKLLLNHILSKLLFLVFVLETCH